MLGRERCLTVQYIPQYTYFVQLHIGFRSHLLYSLSHLNSAREGGEESGTFLLLKLGFVVLLATSSMKISYYEPPEMGGTVALGAMSAPGTTPKLALTTKSYSEGKSSHLHKDMLIDNKMLSAREALIGASGANL